MKNNQSLLNLRRHATRLFAFLFLTLLGTGQMLGAAVTADIAAAYTSSTKVDGSSVTLTGGSVKFSTKLEIVSSSNDPSGAKLGSDGNYVECLFTSSTFVGGTFVGAINTSTTSGKNFGISYTTDGGKNWGAEQLVANDGTKKNGTYTLPSVPTGANGVRIVRRAGTSAYVSSITFELAATAAYTVTFNANGGTCSTSSLTEASAGAGVTLPSATPATGYTFLGWATTDDATEAAYDAGATYKPSADVTLYAVYEVFVQKYAVNFDAGEGTGSMDTKMYAENATFTLPACGFTAPDGKVFAGWSDGVNTYATGDEFTMPAQVVTFTAQWEKVFGLIVKAVAGGSANYTFDTNIIGATCSASLSSKKKVDSGKYFGIEGSFKAGDTININCGSVATGGKVMVFNSKTTASAETLIYSEDGVGVAGDHKFVLTSDQSAIYVYRDNTFCTWNPFINFISVTRPRDILSQYYWGFKKNGASLNNPEDYTWNEGVVTMNDSYKTMNAPEDYTWTNHITYEGDVTNDVDIPVEFTLNGNFWEATKAFDDQTVTIKVPVDKTLNVYVHFVEDWNGDEVWGAIAGNWSDLSSSTETIDGVKWYKMSYNNVAATDIQISNGNGSNSVVFNIAADKTNAVYYVAYNSWDESNFRVAEVADPTRHTINIYFQNPGWHEGVNNFKMWVEDGINGANVYGTTADYEFTSHVTYGGKTWYNATLHYFGDACTIYPKFMENTVQWEASAGIAGNTTNVYIYYNSFDAQADETHKTFVAGVSTSMLYAEDSNVAQADVTEATTWDWTKASASSSIELGDNTIPSRSEEFGLANVAGINNNANFNAAALTMVAQFPTRDKKYAQATSVKFHTTVPGMVTVVFSNTGSDRPNRYLHVNGVSTGVGSNASTEKHKTATAFVGAGDVLINAYFNESDFTDGSFTTNGKTTSYDANNQMLRIYSITFTPGYSRSVSAGFGTICLPYAVEDLPEGYTFYNVTGVLGTETVTGIEVEEVNALVAGKPYVFDAEAAGTLTLECTGDAAAVQNTDYLTGNLTATTMAVPQGSYLILKTDNKLHKIDFSEAVIQPNKAYFTLTPNGSVTPAPGRRVIYVADATDTATGLDNLNATDMQKFMQDGHIYIRVADRIYDATGRLVK